MSRPFLSSIGIVFICGLFLLIGFLSLNQMFIYTPDSARYLVWANSIAQGEGFTDTTTPEVSRYVVHAPLYSLLLAPIVYFFAQNVLAAKGTTLLIGCLVLIFFYIWTKKKVGEPIALLGSLILALNSHMIVFSTQILSDAPFAVCLVLYFILAEKLLEKENPPMIMEMSFIAAIIAGIFLREVGFALLLGAVVFYVWKKRYRSAAVLSLATLLIYLLWYVRNEIIVAGVENPALRNTNVFFMHLYTSSRETIWAEFGARLLDNVSVYTRLAGKLLFLPGYPGHASSLISPSDPLVGLVLYAFPVIQFILICATVGICTIGVWHELKNPKIFSLVLIYLIFYCGLILLYPINDIRFLFPLLLLSVIVCTAAEFSPSTARSWR